MIIRLCAILLMLAGCADSGRSESTHVRVTTPAGQDVVGDSVSVVFGQGGEVDVRAPAGADVVVGRGRAVQPVPPKSAASTSAGDDGSTGDTGDAAKPPVSIGPTFLAGIVLMIGGLGLWLTKRAGIAAVIAPGPTGLLMRAASVMPRGFGLALAGLGAGLLVLPWVLDQIPPWLIPAAVITVGGSYLVKYFWNLRSIRKGDS